MGWGASRISPDRGVGISWLNQFIGNLWGVRSGRLIPGDQVLSTCRRAARSDSIISTYLDDEGASQRRFLTWHRRPDKYRTPINSPLHSRATRANVARRN